MCISQLLNSTGTLEKLDISWNNIGDDGMEVISEALKHNKSLKLLRVYSCGLSVQGIYSTVYINIHIAIASWLVNTCKVLE